MIFNPFISDTSVGVVLYPFASLIRISFQTKHEWLKSRETIERKRKKKSSPSHHISPENGILHSNLLDNNAAAGLYNGKALLKIV